MNDPCNLSDEGRRALAGSLPGLATCAAPEPSPARGLMALKDTSHFTIRATDPTTVPFYLELFGFQPLAYQAATPGWRWTVRGGGAPASPDLLAELGAGLEQEADDLGTKGELPIVLDSFRFGSS